MKRTSLFALIGMAASLIPNAGASGAILFVNDDAPPGGDGQTWATAYPSLQDALEEARNSEDGITDIWVAGGTYKPDQGLNQTPGDRAATFLVTAGLRLYGGFAGNENPATFDLNQRNFVQNETVLQGDLGNNDTGTVNTTNTSRAENTINVVTCSGTTDPVLLDGLTIAGGNGYIPGGPWADGAGVYCIDARAIMRNCVIKQNSALHGGGFYSTVPGQEISHCRFQNNYAALQGGGAFVEGTISDSLFTGNAGQTGGGAKVTQSTVTNCSFDSSTSSNLAAGVECFGPCAFTGCSFINNQTALRGGGALCNGATSFTACTFARNRSILWGAAIHVAAGAALTLTGCNIANHPSTAVMLEDTSPLHAYGCTFSGGRRLLVSGLTTAVNALEWRFTHCVFAGSTRGVDAMAVSTIFEGCSFSKVGGPTEPAITLKGAAVEVRNCILADGGNEIFNQSGGLITVAYSLVQGGWAGAGNVTGDPLYARLPSDGGDGWGDDTSTNNVDEGANDDIGDLRLRRGSPCIDAGNNALVPPDANDLDNDNNVAEPIPFDLAVNPRFVDDPSAADTGVGPPPIVDMGAYEFQNPPLITAAVSRRTHTGQGNFDVDLLTPLPDGASPSEYRQGGPQKLVITFDRPIACRNGCDPGDVSASAGTVTQVVTSGNTVDVSLSGVPNQACLRIGFPGIIEPARPWAEVYQKLAFVTLVGDSTGNDSADIFDLVQMRNVLNQSTTAANYRFDVNTDGTINIFDMVVTRNALNKIAACP